MKKYAIWIVIGILVVIGIILFFVYRKKQKDQQGGSSGSGSSGSGSNQTVYLNDASFPLKKGSKGKEVVILQGWMNLDYGKSLVCDGDFGTNTLNAWSDVAKNYIIGADSSQVSREMYLYKVNPELSRIKTYLSKKGINV